MEHENLNLLVKYLSHELNSEEEKAFEAWRLSSDANEKIIADAEKVWQQSPDPISDEELIISIGSDKEKVWAGIAQKTKDNQIWISSKPQKWYYGIAASIALLIGFFILQNQWVSSDSAHLISVLAKDSIRQVTLPDSSVVWLQANSSLSYYDFEGKESRDVILDGRAFFEVKRDESKPFSIETNNALVTVLGTSFELSSTGELNAEELIVTTGRVAYSPLENRSKKIELIKGERAVLTGTNSLPSKSINSDRNYLSWKTGILTFENDPLEVVDLALSNHYDVDIRLDASLPSDKRLTASFKDKELDQVLDVLCALYNMKYKSQNGIINLYVQR
ncbi:FecR family protein [Reichenbachiella versicolor]|uniref:FecR family protein n=1 Tax=Reichenbachiella versicolor TaxID=1821036 RepID=UPI000D6E3613|nr:FecR domain-containing protein [Reichenbachiella versicolor]